MNGDAPNSGNWETKQDLSPWSEAEQLHAAIQITDTIRRYEKEQMSESSDSKPKSPAASESSFDPLAPLRNFLEVPGVIPGCLAAGFGIAAMIPARRSLLRVCDKYWNLGTTFPDLIVTPMLTIYVAQCSLWYGSLYGSSFYLNKLASFPVDSRSNTVDTVCEDPIIMNAALRLPSKTPSSPDQRARTSLTASFGQWDPQQKLLSNFQDAVRSCQRRRDNLKNREKLADEDTR